MAGLGHRGGNLYPVLVGVFSDLTTNRIAAPEAWVMHPRRWAWALAQINATNGLPYISPDPIQNAATARFERVAAEAFVGSILGIPVALDPNVPTNLSTNQDAILLERPSDYVLMEDGYPRIRVFEEVLSGKLALRIQLYNYVAFFGDRYPKATAKITGTGLSATV